VQEAQYGVQARLLFIHTNDANGAHEVEAGSKRFFTQSKEEHAADSVWRILRLQAAGRDGARTAPLQNSSVPSICLNTYLTRAAHYTVQNRFLVLWRGAAGGAALDAVERHDAVLEGYFELGF